MRAWLLAIFWTYWVANSSMALDCSGVSTLSTPSPSNMLIEEVPSSSVSHPHSGSLHNIGPENSTPRRRCLEFPALLRVPTGVGGGSTFSALTPSKEFRPLKPSSSLSSSPLPRPRDVKAPVEAKPVSSAGSSLSCWSGSSSQEFTPVLLYHLPSFPRALLPTPLSPLPLFWGLLQQSLAMWPFFPQLWHSLVSSPLPLPFSAFPPPLPGFCPPTGPFPKESRGAPSAGTTGLPGPSGLEGDSLNKDKSIGMATFATFCAMLFAQSLIWSYVKSSLSMVWVSRK